MVLPKLGGRISGVKACSVAHVPHFYGMPPPKKDFPESSASRPGNRSPSVRELAVRLGMGASTVARALRNASRVSAETRERVLKEAEKAGYRSNALVKALMSDVRRRRTVRPSGEVLAFLTSDVEESVWKKLPSHLAQFEGAREKAATSGFDLQAMWMGPAAANFQQTMRMMYARGVRGALLAPSSTDANIVGLDSSRFAIVGMGFSFPELRIHRVVHDGADIVYACYSRLHGLGYRRIGIAVTERYAEYDRHYFINGFLGAQWYYSIANIPPLIIKKGETPIHFTRWLEKHRPDAVLGIWPDKQLSWIQKYGLSVPGDIGYATIDIEGGNDLKIAGMVQNNREQGASAMDLLTGQIFRNETGFPDTPALSLIKGMWQNGETVRDKA